MQRSKLFRESPRRGPRAEALFDKLVQDTEKKEKEEKTMREFEKTLEQSDDEDNDKESKTGNDSEDIINIVDEEPVRRRVIPKLPGRKPINRAKKTTNGKKKN